jgi:GxxExxY protein
MDTTRRWNVTARTKDTKLTKDTKAIRSMRPNETSYKVIGLALNVHSALGAGLLESAYHGAFSNALTKAGLHFQHEARLSVKNEGTKLFPAYKVDSIVERCLLVEIKSVTKVLPVHKAQLLSYLRLTGYTLGLLLNFNVPHMRDGIHRLINGPESEL